VDVGQTAINAGLSLLGMLLGAALGKQAGANAAASQPSTERSVLPPPPPPQPSHPAIGHECEVSADAFNALRRDVERIDRESTAERAKQEAARDEGQRVRRRNAVLLALIADKLKIKVPEDGGGERGSL
jgi:hypothetical protein